MPPKLKKNKENLKIWEGLKKKEKANGKDNFAFSFLFLIYKNYFEFFYLYLLVN